MRRSSLCILYLLAIGIWLAILIAFFVDRQDIDPAIQTSAPSIRYTVISLAAPWVVFGSAVMYIAAWGGAQIRAARGGQWGWLVFLLVSFDLFPPSHIVILPIYIFTGSKSVGPRSRLPTRSCLVGVPLGATGFSAAENSGHILETKSLTRVAVQLADWRERASAALIDFWVFLITLVAVVETMYAINADVMFLSQSNAGDGKGNGGEVFLALDFAAVWVSCLVVSAIFAFVVWPLQWVRNGQTFGQRVMSIQVISESGQQLRYGTAVRRAIAKVCLDPAVFGIPLGWLWIFIDRKSQAWHDKVAGTVVVRTGLLNPDGAG